MKKIIIAMLLVAGTSFAFAHSGGTDKNGCHNDRKNGGYHCH
ncbi:YHYH domain-containing protein [Herminiimonas arsenitoxidans]|nr:YHYH domain-containing protein [Herminiimonas arsenitoxidans]